MFRLGREYVLMAPYFLDDFGVAIESLLPFLVLLTTKH